MEVEGAFSLKPKYILHQNKSFYLVKLTDFAQKLLNNGSIDQQGQISLRFTENQGTIKLLPSSHGSNKKEIDLHFTIQEMAIPTEGAFECTKYKKGAFSSMGSIKQKFIISATDDIYATTREKMTIAEEKNKLNRVKEIKMPKLMSKKSAFKRSTLTNIVAARTLPHSTKPEPFKGVAQGFRAGNKPASTLFRSTNSVTNVEQANQKLTARPAGIMGETKKVITTTPTNLGGAKEQNSTKLNPSNAASFIDPRKKCIPETVGSLKGGAKDQADSQALSTPSAPCNGSSLSFNAFKPIPFTFEDVLPKQPQPVANGLTGGPSQLPEAGKSKFSLKDVVIHTLALRPYKRSELIQKLEKDHPNILASESGVTFSTNVHPSFSNNQQLASLLSGILNSLAVFNNKNSCYSLARHGFAEIQLDWPLYNDNERAYVKRKLPTSSSPKPIDNKTPSNLKNLNVTASSATILHGDENPSSLDKSTPLKTVNALKSPKPSVADGRTSGIQKRPLNEMNQYDKTKTNDSANTETEAKRKRIGEVDNLASNKDFLKLYTVISSSSQRQNYKEVFDSEYQEYLTLHKKLQAVWSKFCKMEAHLNSLANDSLGYKETKSKIYKEYKDTVNTESNYTLRRKRFDYLHAKLSHIKQLVSTYDFKHVNKESSAKT